ncbi:hypothetical protein [Flavobacterium sp. '19STA2R22 D10 B1']|uniref:hypothetical protein n=1 Tax=Flavobacterium aerium TaxID=3037261 RepID=UPI00278BB896|nr:hypothetical protein [Flavobacterium sp. '19STA2R22 D10 B1']
MVNKERKINEFWNWFSVNQLNLQSDKISNENISQLNREIMTMGDFNWEVREGNNAKNMLIISPGGDLNLLSSTKRIIELAPEIEDWEFYYYKPSKKWNYRLVLNEEMNVKKILDVKNWEYVLYKFSDGTFDIILKTDNLNELDENQKALIADIVLESILGEEQSLKFIKNVEFVDEFNDLDKSKKNPIKFLQEHFAELI